MTQHCNHKFIDSTYCLKCGWTPPKKITQQEAINKLEEIMGRELTTFSDCTGDASTCPIEECMLCAVRDCPGDEPLHYHHDGCPYCDGPSYNEGDI